MERKSRQQWLTRVALRPYIVRGLIAFVAISVLSQSFMVVDASLFANGGSTSFRATQAFSDDAGIVVTSTGIRKISSTSSATGGSPLSVEATSPLSAVNNALTQNHYAYKFQVQEASSSSWGVGQGFKIELYGDDGSSNSPLATLYIRQSQADPTNVEGVIATIDLGSSTSIPDRFDIIVTRQ